VVGLALPAALCSVLLSGSIELIGGKQETPKAKEDGDKGGSGTDALLTGPPRYWSVDLSDPSVVWGSLVVSAVTLAATNTGLPLSPLGIAVAGGLSWLLTLSAVYESRQVHDSSEEGGDGKGEGEGDEGTKGEDVEAAPGAAEGSEGAGRWARSRLQDRLVNLTNADKVAWVRQATDTLRTSQRSGEPAGDQYGIFGCLEECGEHVLPCLTRLLPQTTTQTTPQRAYSRLGRRRRLASCGRSCQHTCQAALLGCLARSGVLTKLAALCQWLLLFSALAGAGLFFASLGAEGEGVLGDASQLLTSYCILVQLLDVVFWLVAELLPSRCGVATRDALLALNGRLLAVAGGALQRAAAAVLARLERGVHRLEGVLASGLEWAAARLLRASPTAGATLVGTQRALDAWLRDTGANVRQSPAKTIVSVISWTVLVEALVCAFLGSLHGDDSDEGRVAGRAGGGGGRGRRLSGFTLTDATATATASEEEGEEDADHPRIVVRDALRAVLAHESCETDAAQGLADIALELVEAVATALATSEWVRRATKPAEFEHAKAREAARQVAIDDAAEARKQKASVRTLTEVQRRARRYTAHRKVNAADLNRDDQIDLYEYAAWQRARHPELTDEQLRARFAEMDVDGDGKVSVDERHTWALHSA